MRRAFTTRFSGRVKEIMLKGAKMQINICKNSRNSNNRRAHRKRERN